MKKTTLYLFTMLLLIQFSAIASGSKLVLQTDKQSYISGENIAFKCTMTEHELIDNNILYVDICGEGYTITSQILLRLNSHWDGQITLPDTLQTGVYLLRAYIGNTEGIPTLTSQAVSVFNRFGNNEINELRKKISINEAYYPALDESLNSSMLKVNAAKSRYKTNESISFDIENNVSNNIGGVSLDIFKIEDFKNSKTKKEIQAFTPNNKIKVYNRLFLRGKLTEKSSGEPVNNETMLLSVPDSIAYINYAHTDSLGEFKFLLNDFYGLQDMIIQTIDKKKNYNIEIYPILLAAPTKIPFYVPVEVEESEFVKLAVTRATIHKAYGKPAISKPGMVVSKFPFYGKTEVKVYPSEYVDLDDFEEIAWEILPMVKYRREQGVTSVRLWAPENKTFYGNPWLLVDGIPVFNAENLNVLDSKKIDWIELQPQIRCYGDLLIEGVLAIGTYNRNFTDVALPKNAVRMQVNTYYDNNTNSTIERPLFSDILYWNPTLKEKQVTVKTSSEKGTYAAVLQTVDSQGKPQRSIFNFTVE